MNDRDFETKLDDALTQFAQGASVDTEMKRAPDVADLISLVEHLQILAPVPDVRLTEGRRKFLNEAARLVEPRVAPRRVPAFAFATLIVLLMAGILIAAVVFGQSGSSDTPSMQATLEPTQSPTYSETPRTMIAPNRAIPNVGTVPVHTSQIHVPHPVPTPEPGTRQTQRSYAMTWDWFDA